MFVNCFKCSKNKKESQFKLICKIKNVFIIKVVIGKEKAFVLFNFGFSNCDSKVESKDG